MPRDSMNKFHLSTQRAAAADRMPKDDTAKDTKASVETKADSGNSTTLHDHGDGTFHTVSGGQKTEHPAIGHALMSMAAKHAGGSHQTTHDDGMDSKSYHVDDSGDVQDGLPGDGDPADDTDEQAVPPARASRSLSGI